MFLLMILQSLNEKIKTGSCIHIQIAFCKEIIVGITLNPK